MDWKDNVSFVLVEPSEPANVGSSARAMKNMGFKNLAVVNPPEDPEGDARRLARNATDVLKAAREYTTLAGAVADAALVIGSTRRTGKRRGMHLTAAEAALKVFKTASRGGRVALLFGRERTGLLRDELEECSYMIHIPADPRQPSLNLAQAVMVVAYEIAKLGPTSAGAEVAEMSTHEERAELAGKFRRVLELIGYPADGERTIGRKILVTIKHSLGRAALTEEELASLDGICARLIKRLEK